MLIRIFLYSCLSLACSTTFAAEDAAQVPDRKAVADFNTCPKAQWPIESLRLKHKGVVTVAFLIAEDGQVREAYVKKSSGDSLLDTATLVALKKCKFQQGLKGGKPTPAWMQMQYVWTLE